MTSQLPRPGWYRDPTEQSDGRYWNGSAWTESVLQAGVAVNVPIDLGRAQLPPLAGTEMSVPFAATAPIPPSVPTPQRSGSSGVLAGVVGLAVVILVVVVVVLALTGGDSTDTPPDTDPPATDAPATDAPAVEDAPATDAPAVEDAPASDDAGDG